MSVTTKQSDVLECLLVYKDYVIRLIMDKNNRVAIITGATSGIGKETAIALAGKGFRLVLPVRDQEKGEALKRELAAMPGKAVPVELFPCRLDSLDSVRAFAGAFREKYDRLDLLVNNAGIWEMHRRESVDGIEMNFAVNHLAPFLMTNLLLDMLREAPPARVINLSSMAHRFAFMCFSDLEGKKRWNAFFSYAQSKLANILFANRLARELNGDGVTVNSMHPGFVKTHLFDQMPALIRKPAGLIMVSPARGAETVVYLATSPEVQGISGAYFAGRKMTKPSSVARNAKHADKLWEISKEYCEMK